MPEDFNISNNIYNKKQKINSPLFSIHVHLWTQPSTLDGYPSPTAESRPTIGDERALHQAQSELEECEQVNRELRKRIVQLESENDDMHRLAMETEERMSSMQSELERKVWNTGF